MDMDSFASLAQTCILLIQCQTLFFFTIVQATQMQYLGDIHLEQVPCNTTGIHIFPLSSSSAMSPPLQSQAMIATQASNSAMFFCVSSQPGRHVNDGPGLT